ncbi:MAG: carotenoid 1,2-hydratase [Myxococcota bacterium]
MIGNPFSPGYAKARRRGIADALHFSAMNVAVYRRKRRAVWALDEQPIRRTGRGACGLAIGRSTMRWEDERLVVNLDERTTPLGSPFRWPLRGRVVLSPEAAPGLDLAIDANGVHRWWPIAPRARVQVELTRPAVRFSGHGYHDANAGAGPLEDSFRRWSWSRARTSKGAILTYDVTPQEGVGESHAFSVRDDQVTPLEGAGPVSLGRSRWNLPRIARVDDGHRAGIVRRLEDGPFYNRSLIETRLGGQPLLAMHETLDAERLRRRWVQFCVGYRMHRHD